MNKNQEKILKDLDNFLADPVSGIVNFYNRLDRLDNNKQTSNTVNAPEYPVYGNVLATDIIDEDTHYRVMMDLPGVLKKDINIELDNKYMNITAVRNHEFIKEGKNYLKQERSSQKISRKIKIPDDIEPDSLTATYEDGVLNIIINKIQKKGNIKKFTVV